MHFYKTYKFLLSGFIGMIILSFASNAQSSVMISLEEVKSKAKKIKRRERKMEAKSERMEEIEGVCGKISRKIGAMYLVSNKNLGGDK